MKTIALLTLLALSGSAEARIGETLDECSYRYGASIGHYSHDQVRFNRGHIYITVHVRDHHSIREDFARKLAAHYLMPRYKRFWKTTRKAITGTE